MPLQSRLFAGDAALEAAANSDPAHITTGARGPHVTKIQTALNILDNAGLNADGVYGSGTAAAVLRYKTKRSIINRSYQSSADNIVGKMTMASLDEEMVAHEAKPARLRIVPVSPGLNAVRAVPSLNFKITLGNADIAAAGAAAGAGGGTTKSLFGPVPRVTLPVFSIDSVTIDPGQTAQIDIKNGAGFQLTLTDFQFATGSPSAVMLVPGINGPVNHFTLNVDSIRIEVKGIRWGSPILFAQNSRLGPEFTEKLVVNVRDLRPDIFHPSDTHHHEPVREPMSGRKSVRRLRKIPTWALRSPKWPRTKSAPQL
ncbi:hypothetical protein F183_A40380 [Bryobacterales bacterium F-183]|nr:hypothetical protein F183_A40380 [Bryobacterales bacterium F-183]